MLLKNRKMTRELIIFILILNFIMACGQQNCNEALYFREIIDTNQLYKMRNCFRWGSDTQREFYRHYTHCVLTEEHFTFPKSIPLRNQIDVLNDFLDPWRYISEDVDLRDFSEKLKGKSKKELERELVHEFYSSFISGYVKEEENEKNLYNIVVNVGGVGSSTIRFLVKEDNDYKIIDEDHLYERVECALRRRFGKNYDCRYGYIGVINGEKYLIAQGLSEDDANCCPSIMIAIKRKKNEYFGDHFFLSYAFSDEFLYNENDENWKKL